VKSIEEVAQPGIGEGVHLPAPSYWPIVVAVSLPLIAYGLIFNLALCVLGGLVLIAGIYGWGLEGADDEDAIHGHVDGGGHDGHDGGHAEPEADEPATEVSEEVAPVD
jgi:cytochrome c oxidase subunit 1